MTNATERYFVRFAVHIKDVYRANFLDELAQNTGVTIQEAPDGRIEITDFRPAKSGGWVLHALEQEQNRGALIIEESN